MCQRPRNDLRWLGSSRSRSSGGGSSVGSDVILGGGTGCGGVGDSARAETSARASWRAGPPKERGGVVMRQCQEYRRVPGFGIPSRVSTVDPRRQSVPRGLSRRSRGVSQPCNDPLGQGIHPGELSSPGYAAGSRRGTHQGRRRRGGKHWLEPRGCGCRQRRCRGCPRMVRG